MNRTPLQQAAFCALADMENFYHEDYLLENLPVKKTVKELYEALQLEGCDVSDYANIYQMVCADLTEAYHERLAYYIPQPGPSWFLN